MQISVRGQQPPKDFGRDIVSLETVAGRGILFSTNSL